MASREKQRAPKGQKANASDSRQTDTISDPRFANFQTDPRYRLPSKKHAKVRVDSRFSRMLQDDDFHRKAKVDRYGRRVKGDKGKRDLERLYELSDEGSGSELSGEDDAVVEQELQKASKVQKAAQKGYDPARDGGFSSSSSDSSDEEEVSVDEDVDESEAFGTSGQGEVPMGEVTSRIAIVNLDWDNIRAVDLMAVASSFKPPEGRILNVTVYPSEFGRERMAREELEGPPAEIFAQGQRARPSEAMDEEEPSEASSDEQHESTNPKPLHQSADSKDFDSTALRRYQLDRLRYFYAVVTCSSDAVAQALYEDMDGREYLSSANFFDLRFVPDDVSFDDDAPRDSCDEVPDGYRPNDFVTDALQHSRVKLTWDEDDRGRKDMQKRAFGRGGMDVEENDLMAYVASATSSEGENSDDDEDSESAGVVNSTARFGIQNISDEMTKDAKPVDKKDRAAAIRAALGLANDAPLKASQKPVNEKPVGNLQVTFSAGLSSVPRKSVFENEPEETTKEKYVRKERERKAKRKEKSKAGRNDEISAPHSDAVEVGTELALNTAEDGFDDPFFEDPATANRDAAKKAKKAEKDRLKKERAADEEATAKQRAELELLMADEEGGNRGRVRHFDMNEIEKEEKQRRKKNKAKRGKAAGNVDILDEDRGATGADFRMKVDDPRFARVFESHEYAIDPNDPRFKGTEGMKALLEETRKRRGKRKDGDVSDEERHSAKLQKKAKTRRRGDEGEGLDVLVQKVKSRALKS